MWTFSRLVLVPVIALLGLGLLSNRAEAGRYRQVPIGPMYVNPFPVNQNWMVAPGLTLKQWAYNTSVIGQAYANVPPYMLGYNPYPRVINYGPTFPAPIYNGVNPYAAYSGLYNPYAYGAYFNPYAVNGYGYLFP